MAAGRPRTTRSTAPTDRDRNVQSPTPRTGATQPSPIPPITPVSGEVPVATFAQLGVPAAVVTALAANGVTAPFPIQAATLPHSMAGRDVLGRGRTGSGKTYAFLIPVVTRLAASNVARQPGRPRALILAPTRELATQIEAAVAPLASSLGLRTMTIFGGVGANPQIATLRKGVDIVIACPGRLADHLESGHVNLGSVEITVLDEADHMADLGFLPVVRRLMDHTPKTGQRLLFSATLDGGVDVLVRRFLKDPVTQSVDSSQSPVATMTHHVLHLQHEDRLQVLVELAAAPGRTLVFTRTKHRAKTLTRQLIASGVPAVELHGNLAQNARTRNLTAFSDGTARTLVATDIAARGIHVDDVTLVIHADPPAEHKAYLHRSGRTARAGNAGTVITLMTDDQIADVRDLTRQAGIKPTTTRLRPGHALLSELAPGERIYVTPAPAQAHVGEVAQGPRSGRGGGGGRRSGGQSGRDGGAARGGTARDSGGVRHESGGAQRGSAGRDGAGRSAAARDSGRGRTAATGGSRSTGGSVPVHSTSTGSGASSTGTSSRTGIAAFSASSRAGRRRG